MIENPKQLIDKLGGATKLAQAIGSTPAAVGKWPVHGIPFRHHAMLRQVARRRVGMAELDAALAWGRK